eukprot:5081887-Prymnesium_polylepis.3
MIQLTRSEPEDPWGDVNRKKIAGLAPLARALVLASFGCRTRRGSSRSAPDRDRDGPAAARRRADPALRLPKVVSVRERAAHERCEIKGGSRLDRSGAGDRPWKWRADPAAPHPAGRAPRTLTLAIVAFVRVVCRLCLTRVRIVCTHAACLRLKYGR